MNTKTILKLTIIFSTILIACNNQEKNEKIEGQSIPKNNTPVGEKKQQKSNFELLQGKWQSEDDKSNFLVFDKNIRKEIVEGMESWDEEEFLLSTHCENQSNSTDKSAEEKGNYISCKTSDLCWYIMSLNDERLTLQFEGRGNTLTYTRVNE